MVDGSRNGVGFELENAQKVVFRGQNSCKKAYFWSFLTVFFRFALSHQFGRPAGPRGVGELGGSGGVTQPTQGFAQHIWVLF